MSVNSVSITNAQGCNKIQNNQPSFKGGTSVQTKQEGDSFFSQHKKGIAVAGAIAGTAALVTALTVLAKKGRLGESAKEFANKIFKPKNIQEVVENADDNKLLKNIIKDKGIKFDKGVATLEDGSKFTGVVKNSKSALEYTDGKIMKSTIDGKFEKLYSYTGDGLLDEVTTKYADGGINSYVLM